MANTTPLPLPFNPSDHENHVRCFYPLSGQYGLLPRLQFYLLIVFTIFINVCSNDPDLWLIILSTSAAGIAMTYSGIAAIHSIFLVVWRQKSPFDVDIVGAYALVSVGLVISIPLLTWSKHLRKSSGGLIVALWGMLMLLGTICTMVAVSAAMRKTNPISGHLMEEETACHSPAGVLLTSPIQLHFDPSYACTYRCFSAHVPSTRLQGSMVAVLESQVQDIYFRLSLILAIMIILFTLVTAVMVPWYIGKAPFLFDRDRREDLRNGWIWELVAIIFYVVGCPLLCTANVVLNEAWLNAGGFPQDERLYQVGQWAPWVETALVGIAVGAKFLCDRYHGLGTFLDKLYVLI